ncbi:DUF1588 domain-containing protein [Verrucomicrobium spinosum]|uniref:DUF1588 domain-containing protein n=1 Tax=Verrucomicrobium spinosum TaxID=2736 RepID=UPI0009E72373
MEAHRADKACASCHDKIDPLGFALEAMTPSAACALRTMAASPLMTPPRSGAVPRSRA